MRHAPKQGQSIHPLRRACLCLVAVLACGAAGCSHLQPHQVHIAVVLLVGGESYWDAYEHAIARQAQRYGYSVSFAAPQSEMDYQTQADMVRDAINRHVDGIIISPQHQLVLASVLERAQQAGIPVVVAGMTIALPARDYAASIQYDNRQMGTLAAARIVALTHGRGRVAIIGVSPTLEVTSERERALTRALAGHSHMQVAATSYGLSDWARSRQATLDTLADAPPGHPVRAVFCSDEFSTLGALGALQSLAHRPVFIGVGQEPDTLRALRRGQIDALLVTSPEQLGLSAIRTLHAVLTHQPYARQQVQPVQLIDRSSSSAAPVP